MKYKVQLWCGAGYWMDDEVIIEDASCDEDALIQASLKDDSCFYKECDKMSNEEFEELSNDDAWVYLDRTEYDSNCIFLCIVNAKMECLE